MKKLYQYAFQGLIICNMALAQSSLPECEGNDNNISKFSIKHFSKMKKWTNCYGTGMGPKLGGSILGNFIKENFTDKADTFTKAGRKYVGQYKNHQKARLWNVCTYANGDKYVGEWKKHKYDGQGTYIYANLGDTYVGEWKKHKYNTIQTIYVDRDGQGTYIYANGDTYVGEWKKGLRNGKGTFTHYSGKVEEGIWKKDKLVKQDLINEWKKPSLFL